MSLLKKTIRLWLITNSTDVAKFAVQSGADRIFIDLEINGKVERQGHLSTVISRHTFEDLGAVREAVPDTELLVRLNPLHPGSAYEVEEAVSRGADILMLPMFRSADEVRRFTALVAGRAPVCLLVETVGAMDDLDAIVLVEGVSEIHIGLNDLHLELGNHFMFEPVADGLVDRMAGVIGQAGIPFGFGGVARVGDGDLPVELVLAEHARLGSTAAILSRSFHRNARTVEELQTWMDLGAEISRLRQIHAGHLRSPSSELDALHGELQQRVKVIAGRKAAAADGDR